MSVLLILFAYFLGAVPFGLLVAKRLCGVDPREAGSKNVGATNVARLCGLRYGAATLAFDLTKGLLPVVLALKLDLSSTAVSLVGLAALLGHCYSVFLGFSGGKAVATTIGVFLPIATWQLLAAVGLAIAIAFVSGYMSLGSLALASALFAFTLFSSQIAYAPLAGAVMLLIVWRHRANIQRLVRGEEITWRKKKEV
jgi:glycerol-3-phosphate acyltransferase PlsY